MSLWEAPLDQAVGEEEQVLAWPPLADRSNQDRSNLVVGALKRAHGDHLPEVFLAHGPGTSRILPSLAPVPALEG